MNGHESSDRDAHELAPPPPAGPAPDLRDRTLDDYTAEQIQAAVVGALRDGDQDAAFALLRVLAAKHPTHFQELRDIVAIAQRIQP